ncbi:MAG: glycoside hydrolase family 2 protein [Candidatus Helarchaeota archaeon]
MSLNGTWKAKPDNENIGETEGYYEIDYDDSSWTPIKVPGHWQDEGFPDHQGIMWYRYNFEASEELKQFFKIIRLQFKGVFYYCTVWLNEEKLGSHEGYFDPFTFNVTSFIDKENVLCVKVECMDEPDRSKKRQITGVFSDWDASDPSFNPGGIWGDVALIVTGPTYFQYIEIKPEIVTETQANLYFRFEVYTDREGEKKFRIELKPHNFTGPAIIHEEFYEKLQKGENEIIHEINLEDAYLWWTHDHGYPHLYQLKCVVAETEGVSDEQTRLIGIREFNRVIRGRSWEFYLNKKRIYIRGANYAPCDHRLANVTRENYERDVDLLVQGNFNMIRVHAHVDRIELHEVCAEKGILIWQDFALQWGYDMKIEEIAKTQIQRMVRQVQNYPSQAVYCCHNEPFIGISPRPIGFMLLCLLISYAAAGLIDFYFGFFRNTVFWVLFTLFTLLFGLLPTSLFIYNKNKNVLDTHLVEAVLEVDDSIPVIPNSGIMGLLRKGTDLHTYEGWYTGKDYRDAYCYTRFPFKRMVPFVTEYGAQAFPHLENLKHYFKQEDLTPVNWDLFKKHHRCQTLFFARWFPLDKLTVIDDIVEVTQEYQAELIKFYNELWRIHRYNPSGGAILFLFNDCFPGITWSIVDYWRTPKKAYYAAQLSFSPVYVMADWPKKRYRPHSTYKSNIYVVNDLHQPFPKALVRWELQNSQAISVAKGHFSVDVQADSLHTLGPITYSFPADAQGTYTLLLFLEYSEMIIENKYFLHLKGGGS